MSASVQREVAHILERNSGVLAGYCASSWQLRTLHALRKCRTPALGGHIDRCNDPGCGRLHLSYNSCRNRHCPKCQGHKQESWVRARERELVKAPYYHVVFTFPDALNKSCLYAPKELYGLLFRTAWSVIRDFGANPKFLGAGTGMVAILHTWGQNLSLHPHLHCIVPGGGITQNGKWRYAKGKGKYLFPVSAMSRVFRARFIQGLRATALDLPKSLCTELFKKEWVVYCKQPFYGPEQVVEYVGRYTHKIAISNSRIKSIENSKVTFSAKDYRKGGARYDLTLSDREFIRRFSLHVLPKGFVRIRHYGILSSCKKKRLLPVIRSQTGGAPLVARKEALKHRLCPKCKKGSLVTLTVFDSRGPPLHWIKRIQDQIKHPKK